VSRDGIEPSTYRLRDSDSRSIELGARCTSGEECLPERVVLGSFLKVLQQPDCIAAKTALFMPTAAGPCRFGQYASYIRKLPRDLRFDDVQVFAPSSRDGYREMGEHAKELSAAHFRGLLCADVLRKALHRTRPYEAVAGDADAVQARGVASVARVLERPGVTPEQAPRRQR
jgi:predicted nucleotide-binding protein (sugar kinase/HSP70/actin superfamily)